MVQTLQQSQPNPDQNVFLWADGQWSVYQWKNGYWQRWGERREAQPADQWKPLEITTGQNWRQPT